MTGPFTRRELLEKATAVSAAATLTIVPRHVLGGEGYVAPSEKMNIAGVGLGDMGPANLKNLESENIVALCDVDPNHAARTIQRYSSAKFYTDYRELLDRQKDIDGRGDRDARPHARGDHDGRHPRGQARLLPEASDPRCLRGQDADQGRAGIQGHNPDGNPGSLGRRHPADVRVDLVGPARRGATKSMRGAAFRITPGAMPGGARNGPIAPRRRCPCPPGSTGMSGLARPRCGPTTAPITLPPGGAGGILAAA